jgi:hypothetical protein
VLRFPDLATHSSSALPSDTRQITLQDWSEEHLQQQIAALTATENTLQCFIHLHPLYQADCVQKLCFQENEHNKVKQVFLLAKHLKNSLQPVSEKGRSAFMSVIRLDGTFGLTGQDNFNPLDGGFSGLIKCLNYEWKSTFCRAIDLSPKIGAEQAVQYILAELYDPDRTLVDVGYSNLGRATLIADFFE